MKIIKLLAIILLIASKLPVLSQDNIVGVMNPPSNPCGNYHKENIGNRKPIPYTPLREGDVMWEKRIWRDIDLREKQNQPLYFPIEYNPCITSLFQTLTKHILNGSILAFSDEDFMIPYEPSTIRQKLVTADTIEQYIYDENGNEKIVKVASTDSTSIFRKIVRYRLKEDWFFDKQKSNLEVRIIGIAAYEYDKGKEGYKELFWVYFPSCRPYFATTDVYNFKNDSERRSLDDIFWKRQFTSTIVKESNVYDKSINEYQKGIDALVESENIKKGLFNWEHDIWNY